jgi:hypothetical protein
MKLKKISCPCRELKPGRPARSPSLHRLRAGSSRTLSDRILFRIRLLTSSFDSKTVFQNVLMRPKTNYKLGLEFGPQRHRT